MCCLADLGRLNDRVARDLKIILCKITDQRNADEIQHDRVDHLMRAELRLENSRDRSPYRPGDDRVIVRRIALGFHQPHAPAGGAAVVIGAAVRPAIEGARDILAVLGHQVDGAVAEIDGALGPVGYP